MWVGVGYALAMALAGPPIFLGYATEGMPELWGSIAVGWWVLGSAVQLLLGNTGWHTHTGLLAIARLAWVCGPLTLAFHIAVGLHVVHRWSIADAYARTEEMAGVGEGIYVNFAVLGVWLFDAVWLVGFPHAYARRPRWIRWGIHGFLSFIMFHAVVTYIDPAVRWRGILWFAMLTGFLLARRHHPPTRAWTVKMREKYGQ